MGYTQEPIYLLAMLRAGGGEWHRIATLVDNAGTAEGLVTGQVAPHNEFAEKVVGAVAQRHVDDATVEVASWSERPDMKVWTVLDDDYPSSLRTVFNRPPFIFCRGEWRDEIDRKGLAVVGTRKATDEGLSRARRMADQLAARDVTVISGLALGIDGAAHESALDHPGRTVAVLGSGLDTIYPKQHADLAGRIVESGGALISQFVPTQSPSRKSFPMRNAVMSGLGIGTIVIEANERSGAKMQARLALEHGRALFLLRSLVEKYEWARDYAEKGRYGTKPIVVASIDDVLSALDIPPEVTPLRLKLGWSE
jgi:DNA processing protein